MGELSPPDDENGKDYDDDDETFGYQYVDHDDGNDDEYDYLALLKVAHADDTNCLLAILPTCLARVPGEDDDDDNDSYDEGLLKIPSNCFALAPKVITDLIISHRIKNMTIIIRIIITIIITIRMEHDDQDLRSS